jgi:protein TonB
MRAPRITRRSVIALSEDSQLLEALAGISAQIAEVVLSTSIDRFADQLVAETCGVALIDAAGIVDPIDFIVGLRRQFPELVLVVAGGGHLQAPLTGLLADSSVFRFVHKPASTQRLQLFIEAAVRRHEEAMELESSRRLAALRAPAVRSASRRWWVTAAVLGIAALTALIAIHSSRSPSPTPVPSALAPAGAATVAAGAAGAAGADETPPAGTGNMTDPVLTQMLTNADSALAQHHLVAVDGGGAGDLYRTALQRAPGNPRARQGLDRVTAALLDDTQQAMSAGQSEQAGQLVAEVLRLQPDNVRAATLSVQLSQQRETQLRDQLRRTTALAAELNRRLAAPPSAGPPAPTAASAAASAAPSATPPTPSATAAATAPPVALQAPLVAAPATTEIRSIAATATPAAPTVSAEGTASAAVRPPAAVAPPVAVAPPMAAVAPTVTSGNSSSTVSGSIDSVAASTLQRDHFVPPQYPSAALARGVSGWVDLEFTVTTTGAVEGAVITAAQPRDTFDAAAMAAIKEWHFRPVMRDGAPVEQRAHVRMRFSL